VATDRLELPAKGHTNKTPLPDVLGWWPSSPEEINDFLSELQEVWLIIARGSYESQNLSEGYGVGVCQRGWRFAFESLRGSFGVLNSDRSDVKYQDFKEHKLDREIRRLLRAH